jgi:hypothetical protein
MRSARLAALALVFLTGLYNEPAPTSAGRGVLPEPGLLFYLSGERGLTADYSLGGTPEPNFASDVTTIPDGARGPGIRCGNLQRYSYWAPGNIYAQRGTLAFFWRSRDPVGPTEFPIFRVAYADHSSWDMVWLRIDYNGHGFDAFVTDAGLSRIRVSHTVTEFPAPGRWTHLAFSWDETRGICFYVNGKRSASKEAAVVLDAGLDQFGPHSRIISPHQVQSDYNFVRGGDIDEVRIYDRMLPDDAVAALARLEESGSILPPPVRNLADARWRDEWWLRYGWNRPANPPPDLSGNRWSVRKVEIHDAYDLKRWWWKANDGIRETTWPGVYNRSRLPGRNDYFQLPDWDCYSLSGKSVTFTMPQEPWNHVEISGPAWGRVSLVEGEAPEASREVLLFERPAGQEKTVHRLAASVVGKKVRFENVEQEQPIGEFAAYHVREGSEPAGTKKLAYRLASTAPRQASLSPLISYIAGRHVADERAMLVAEPATASPSAGRAGREPLPKSSLPLVHILIPSEAIGPAYQLDLVGGGLDGIAFDLPALNVKPTHGSLVPLNIQVKDPLWPMRNMLDFTFSVKPGEAMTLWLDLRDRILPPGKGLYLTIAAASPQFGPAALAGAGVRLVFKEREAARAEHELDRFTQVRDCYAMWVEERPHSPQLKLWVRLEADLADLLRVNPSHGPGRSYWASVSPGAPRPPFVQPEPPAGEPLWAFRQVEALGRVKRFVRWWIDNRQIDNGEFGGGLSDDTDLTNLWPGVAFMGADPDVVRGSLRRELEACYRQGMFTNGLPTIQADELHSYEEGINALGQNLILDFGNPRQLERAMETTRSVAGLTGVNAAGHRHFRSSYYSGTRVAEDGVWGGTKAYSYLVLQPAQLLVEYNGNPTAKTFLLEVADGLLAHRRLRPDGQYALPTAIQFRSDQEGVSTRTYFPWGVFWTAWQWTGERRYLDPILDGGPASIMAVNHNALDIAKLRKEWGPRILSGETSPRSESRSADGRPSLRANTYRASAFGPLHFAWQLTGDKTYLERLYGAQIAEMAAGEYINTQGSLWSDRVGVPNIELQRARLGGIALVRNGLIPGHVVSWRFTPPATERSIALLIPDATPRGFTVVAHNLESMPVRAEMTGWGVEPGEWEVAEGIDTNGDDRADQALSTRVVTFERSRFLTLTFAPLAATVLRLSLKNDGTPYWQRPDLGCGPEDVVIIGREVRVRIHSLGSVPTPPAVVVFRDRAGRAVATDRLGSLAAPVDLFPKTADVALTLPESADAEGGWIEIDPGEQVEEITRLNNTVRVPATVPR